MKPEFSRAYWWHGFRLVGFTEPGGKHRRALWFAGTFRFCPPLETRLGRWRRRRRLRP